MMNCCDTVHTFVVTQYSTSPYCQYKPVSEKNGTMYIMYFCDAAIGLSGSTPGLCISPRLDVCRTVMNVVDALIATDTTMMIEPRMPRVWVCGKSSLSPRWTPKIVALRALSTALLVRP